jgi:hypothetical protein
MGQDRDKAGCVVMKCSARWSMSLATAPYHCITTGRRQPRSQRAMFCVALFIYCSDIIAEGYPNNTGTPIFQMPSTAHAAVAGAAAMLLLCHVTPDAIFQPHDTPQSNPRCSTPSYKVTSAQPRI